MSQQKKDVAYLNLLKSLEEQNIEIPMADQHDLGLDVGLDLGLTFGSSYNPPTSGLHSQPKTTYAGEASHVARPTANHREGKQVVLQGTNPTYYPSDVACSNRTMHIHCTCHVQGVNAGKTPMVISGMQNQGPPYILESSYVAHETKVNQARVVAAASGRHAKKLPMMRGSENPQDKVEVMSQTPLVTIVGPTGRKLEGFLYYYGTDNIIIVCFCHNLYLSPTNFVRHAGWDDVANPLRQIKIIPPGI